jgi:hypothetical protein
MIMNLADKLWISISLCLDNKGDNFIQRVLGHPCFKERIQPDIIDTGQNSKFLRYVLIQLQAGVFFMRMNNLSSRFLFIQPVDHCSMSNITMQESEIAFLHGIIRE